MVPIVSKMGFSILKQPAFKVAAVTREGWARVQNNGRSRCDVPERNLLLQLGSAWQ